MIENKIEKLHELIASSLSKGQQSYAISLLNDIITSINVKDETIEILKSRHINVAKEDYKTFVEKISDLIIAIGFHPVDLVNYDKDAIKFIMMHKHKFTKPLTVEYFNTMHQLYKYSEWTTGNKPENLTELKNAYTEIEDNRKL